MSLKRMIFKPLRSLRWSFRGLCGLVLLAGVSHPGYAQDGYDAFSVLGTSQALCKPGIESGDQLQAFFRNNPDVVQDVLSSANWQGDPQDLFDAIAAGNFTENLYERGTKFEWTSYQEDGVGKHKPRRVWAGEQAFKGFEVNVTSQCQVHTIVIPNACCNISLLGSTEVAVSEPQITIDANGQDARICSTAGTEVVISQADGTTRTVSLDDSGCWSGVLEPGPISVTATNSGECGVASSSASYEIAEIVEPEVIAAAPSLIPYIGFFGGDETRMLYEPMWHMYFEDGADVYGVFGGLMKPLGENWMLFGQLGYADRDGVSDRLLAPNDTIFLDIGIDRYFGKAFIGAGAGLWNIGDDDYDDGSLFIHAGSFLGESNFQLYVEGRVFTDELDDIDSNNLISGGMRYLFR